MDSYISHNKYHFCQKQSFFYHSLSLEYSDFMSEDLQKENEALRNRVKELEQEVEQWKQTLEKYKESCRFQVNL